MLSLCSPVNRMCVLSWRGYTQTSVTWNSGGYIFYLMSEAVQKRTFQTWVHWFCRVVIMTYVFCTQHPSLFQSCQTLLCKCHCILQYGLSPVCNRQDPESGQSVLITHVINVCHIVVGKGTLWPRWIKAWRFNWQHENHNVLTRKAFFFSLGDGSLCS